MYAYHWNGDVLVVDHDTDIVALIRPVRIHEFIVEVVAFKLDVHVAPGEYFC